MNLLFRAQIIWKFEDFERKRLFIYRHLKCFSLSFFCSPFLLERCQKAIKTRRFFSSLIQICKVLFRPKFGSFELIPCIMCHLKPNNGFYAHIFAGNVEFWRKNVQKRRKNVQIAYKIVGARGIFIEWCELPSIDRSVICSHIQCCLLCQLSVTLRYVTAPNSQKLLRNSDESENLHISYRI